MTTTTNPIIVAFIHQACEWDVRRHLEATMGWPHRTHRLVLKCPELERIPKPERLFKDRIWQQVLLPLRPGIFYFISKCTRQRYHKIDKRWKEIDFEGNFYMEYSGVLKHNFEVPLYASWLCDFFPLHSHGYITEEQRFYLHCDHDVGPARCVEWKGFRNGHWLMTRYTRFLTGMD